MTHLLVPGLSGERCFWSDVFDVTNGRTCGKRGMILLSINFIHTMIKFCLEGKACLRIDKSKNNNKMKKTPREIWLRKGEMGTGYLSDPLSVDF